MIARSNALLRVATVAILATAVVGAAATASADDYGQDWHHDRGEWHQRQPYYGYYQSGYPPGYYAYGPPPPVVYAPPQPVYAPPIAPTISLFFNFR